MAQHRARDNLTNPNPSPSKRKTSILISPEVWERAKLAAPAWALSIGIDPKDKLSMWVEHTLDKAAREQIDQLDSTDKSK